MAVEALSAKVASCHRLGHRRVVAVYDTVVVGVEGDPLGNVVVVVLLLGTFDYHLYADHHLPFLFPVLHIVVGRLYHHHIAVVVVVDASLASWVEAMEPSFVFVGQTAGNILSH